MELFDSHCHLDDEKFNEDRQSLIKNIFETGVTKLITAGYSLESSKKALEIAKIYPQIYTISGISPNDIQDNVEKINESEIEKLKNLEKINEKIE